MQDWPAVPSDSDESLGGKVEGRVTRSGRVSGPLADPSKKKRRSASPAGSSSNKGQTVAMSTKPDEGSLEGRIPVWQSGMPFQRYKEQVILWEITTRTGEGRRVGILAAELQGEQKTIATQCVLANLKEAQSSDGVKKYLEFLEILNHTYLILN